MCFTVFWVSFPNGNVGNSRDLPEIWKEPAVYNDNLSGSPSVLSFSRVKMSCHQKAIIALTSFV